jgi:ABC-2 type transport system permease protein
MTQWEVEWMQRLLDYYRTQAGVTLAVQLQYRVGLMIWMIEIILQPTIYLVVWQATAGSGTIAGFDARGFAAYYLVLMVVDHFTQTWNMWEYEYYIRNGELNGWLLRPFHPVHKDIVQNISFKLLMLIILIPAIILLAVLFQPVLNPPLWAIAAFIPALILAAALMFTLGWLVAMSAFWTVRVMAVNNLYFLVVLFCAGYIAPLEVLPAPLQGIASLLPFRWVLAFPVELLLGRLTVEQTLMGYGAQILWIGLVVTTFNVVWRLAVRRYGAVGG